MVKHAVQASESLLEERAGALRRDASCLGEVGLVLGLRLQHKELVLDLVQTPLQDGFFTASGAPSSASTSSSTGASKKNSSSSTRPTRSSLLETVGVNLDATWVVEHGIQVNSMLAGGVEVLGLYLYCSDKTFKSGRTVTQLVTVLRNLSKSLKLPHNNSQRREKSEPLVLHLDATSRNMAAKMLDGGGDALKTSELKFTKIENNLVRVQSVFTLSQMPQVVTGEQRGSRESSSRRGLRRELNRWSEREASRLSKMTLKLSSKNGEQDFFLNSSSTTPVIDLVKSAGKSSGSFSSKIGMKELTFDIFCAFQATRAAKAAQAEGGSRDPMRKVVYGRMQSGGSINCIGYVYARDEASSIVEALRSDLVRSIKSRIDVYTEDAAESALREKDENVSEDSGDDEESSSALHPFVEAQRDGVQGLNTPITVCLPSRKLFIKDSEASPGSLDFELVYSHYVLPDPDRAEEETIKESQTHLEELLARKGFLPFGVESKEEDRSHAVGGQANIWDPTGRGSAAASAASRSSKVNLSKLKSSLEHSAKQRSSGMKSSGEPNESRNLQIVAALFFVFIALALYQFKSAFQVLKQMGLFGTAGDEDLVESHENISE